MKERKKGLSLKQFLICEALLLILGGVFKFAVIGYTTTAFIFITLAVIVLLYYLLSMYQRRKPKQAKILKIILTVLICIGVAGFVFIEILIISNSNTDKEPNAEYVIVLGAGVNGKEPSVSLEDRLISALNYLNKYPDSTVVLSGGMGEGEEITEAACMKKWLINNEISEERIITEEESTSTLENIQNSLNIIEEDGGNPEGKVAIVSAEYHLYRAKYFAKELGCEPVGVAARTRYISLMVNYFIREAFAIFYSWVM